MLWLSMDMKIQPYFFSDFGVIALLVTLLNELLLF